MLRPANPADLALLPALQLRCFRNEARSRHVLAQGAGRVLPYGPLLKDLLARTACRRSWVLSRRGIPVGVVVVRQRLGPSSWEIDHLQASPKEKHVLDLLDGVSHAVAEMGGHKVFLRLAADSALTSLARQAQFAPYVCEHLFLRPAGPPAVPSPPGTAGTPRKPTEGDEFSLYRLYQSVVPAPAREAEGLTFTHWRESLELPSGWRTQETLVLDCGGTVTGWLSLLSNGHKAVIDLLARPDGPDDYQPLLAAGVEAAGRDRTLLCLLPSYQSCLVGSLDALGFQKIADLVLYVRHVTARVREGQVVAVGAVSR